MSTKRLSSPQPTSTEEHHLPRRKGREPERPALLAAFPEPRVLRPPPGGVLGRDWLLALGLTDTVVSRQHASFERVGPGFVLTDLGSRNGTFVNGERLPARRPTGVHDGDVLRLGTTLLVLREDHPADEPMKPIGKLVGPFGLRSAGKALGSLHTRGARNVLIEGETGTGKELVAQAVRVALRRGDKPYQAVNVGAVTPGTFEGQLFGWMRGAFSGATESSPGLLRHHEGGCVFLDEIGDLPLELQVKLLRVLDNREVLPVGAIRAVTVDIALIGATHRSLDAFVQSGRFREDLLARFDQRLFLPPLRERREDIPAVLGALASRRGHPLGSGPHEVEAIEALMLQDHPTNVRGVDAFLGALEPPFVLTLEAVEEVLGSQRGSARLPLTDNTVAEALAAKGGNKSAAAGMLGVSRGALLRFLEKGKR